MVGLFNRNSVSKNEQTASDAVDFLSRSIVIDMGQLKDELYASEDSHVLGAVEYIEKHYPSAILLIDLIPKDKRKFI
ncbi:MAG TPA: hypothetical protein K8U99_03985 [Enterococcus cecorum]|nr:hypothetical protein [Enterococcus cecorum]